MFLAPHPWLSKANQGMCLTAVGAWEHETQVLGAMFTKPGVPWVASHCELGPVLSPPTCPSCRVCSTGCHRTPGPAQVSRSWVDQDSLGMTFFSVGLSTMASSP